MPRERILMDFGWKFFQGNAADPSKDLGFGKDQGDFSKSGDFWFAKPEMDDAKWRLLDLPHDGRHWHTRHIRDGFHEELDCSL